jgi:hypothetical protein
MNKDELNRLVSAYKAAMSEVANIESLDGYPSYPNEISEFMKMLQNEPWVAYEYQPNKTKEILDSIEHASLTEVRCVLTAAARSERFFDGSWVNILEGKVLDPVISRLQVISGA